MMNEEILDTLDEDLQFFSGLAYQCHLGYLQDYAEAYGFSREIRDGLDKLMAAACVLVYDGPDVIEAVAKAAGVYDEIIARDRERQERE